MYNGSKYAMDVKFRNGLCNCFPSKIEGYGAYKWEDPHQLLDIPQLPDELFELIRTKATIPKEPKAITPHETHMPHKATDDWPAASLNT